MNAAKTCAACGHDESEHHPKEGDGPFLFGACKACEIHGTAQCPGFRPLVGLAADAFRVGTLLAACRDLLDGSIIAPVIMTLDDKPLEGAPFVAVRLAQLGALRAALEDVPELARPHAAAIVIAKRVVAEYLTKGNEIGWKLNASGAMKVVDALEADRRDLPETKDERDEREALDELEALGDKILAELLSDDAVAKAATDADALHKLREFFLACMDYFRAVRGARL